MKIYIPTNLLNFRGIGLKIHESKSVAVPNASVHTKSRFISNFRSLIPIIFIILGDCTSLLHIQTEMDQIDSGEFGIALDWVERGFLPGDVIKCFYLDSEHREPDWVWQ